VDRGECYEDIFDFGCGLGYSHRNGAARGAFRVCGMEETLMLFLMLPAILFFGMWSVLLEPPNISRPPQRLLKPPRERD
jgi:hypothetical protein